MTYADQLYLALLVFGGIVTACGITLLTDRGARR